MKLIEPKLIDIMALCARAREDERIQYEALHGTWDAEEAALGFYQSLGPKFLLVDDNDNPVCAGGWQPIIDGVYQSWMVGTMDNWEKHWVSITKHSRRVMDAMFSQGLARRLQTSALQSRAKACEWYAKGLKMRYESTAVGFGLGGENVVTFVRLQEER